MVLALNPIGLEELEDRLVDFYTKGIIELPLGVLRVIEKKGYN